MIANTPLHALIHQRHMADMRARAVQAQLIRMPGPGPAKPGVAPRRPASTRGEQS